MYSDGVKLPKKSSQVRHKSSQVKSSQVKSHRRLSWAWRARARAPLGNLGVLGAHQTPQGPRKQGRTRMQRKVRVFQCKRSIFDLMDSGPRIYRDYHVCFLIVLK